IQRRKGSPGTAIRAVPVIAGATATGTASPAVSWKYRATGAGKSGGTGTVSRPRALALIGRGRTGVRKPAQTTAAVPTPANNSAFFFISQAPSNPRQQEQRCLSAHPTALYDADTSDNAPVTQGRLTCAFLRPPLK